MVNVGFGAGSLLAILNILLGGYFLTVSVSILLSMRSRRMSNVEMPLYFIQVCIVPAALLLSGVILFFQGWRLDPILQFAFFLMAVPLIFFGLKDFLVMSDRRR